MLSPQETTDLVGQIVANASKLGLIWQIRPATVVGFDSAGNCLVQTDGPGQPVTLPATPVDGLPLTGARVFVVSVPPNGNYVVGTAPLESHARMSGETGSEAISFGPATVYTQDIVFVRPFATAPVVMTNIASAAGATANWDSRAFSVTTTQFTLFLFGPSSTWTGQMVQWAAFVNE